MFSLLKSLEDRSREIASVFPGDDDFLDHEISLVWHLIEDEYGTGHENDEVSDALDEYGQGKITEKKLISILENNKL